MKAKVTDITQRLRVKAGLLLATSSVVAVIAAASIPPYGRFGSPV
jgi:hypothetical protein